MNEKNIFFSEFLGRASVGLMLMFIIKQIWGNTPEPNVLMFLTIFGIGFWVFSTFWIYEIPKEYEKEMIK